MEFLFLLCLVFMVLCVVTINKLGKRVQVMQSFIDEYMKGLENVEVRSGNKKDGAR